MLQVFQKTPGSPDSPWKTTGFNDTMTQTQQSTSLQGTPMTLNVTETALVSTIATGAVRSASISSVTDTFIVPEPGELYLLVVGIVGMIGYRWCARDCRKSMGQTSH